MIRPRYHSSRPDHWTDPRPFQDPSMRKQMFGPIQPMEDTSRPRGLFARLFGLR